MKQKFRLGILGGMGQEATIAMYQMIVDKSKKYISDDQDHIHTIIASNTQIPNRNDAIAGRGQDPVPAMIESVKMLEAADVSLVAIACNTAHNFLPALISNSKLEFVDMIELTAKRLADEKVESVGILATSGTINSHIYKKYLDKVGIKLVVPEVSIQEKTMDLVCGSKGIKRGYLGQRNRQVIQECIDSFSQAEVDRVILACTELCLVAPTDKQSRDYLIDPMDVVTDYLVERYYDTDRND